jgi:hypothetical protein
MVGYNRFNCCCDDLTEFFCETCDDLLKIPGCATVTVNSITWNSQCRDLTLCNDFFGGPFLMQGVPMVDGFNNPFCRFFMTNPCNCSDMGYGPVLAYGPNGPKQGLDVGITCKVGFDLYVENAVYRIKPFNTAGRDVNPGSVGGGVTGVTSPRADPNQCDDFPLSWLGIACWLNLNPGLFKVPRHCYDGITLPAPVAASCDVVFGTTGCDDSLSVPCQDGNLRPTCHWNTDGLNPGWCQDRAPLSYDKYLDTIDIFVPDNFDNNGTLGGAFQMSPRSLGGSALEDFILAPVGGIVDARWNSQTAPGGAARLTLRHPQGFGTALKTFDAPISTNGCGTNLGSDCNAFEDTYVGTFVNCTVSNATEA